MKNNNIFPIDVLPAKLFDIIYQLDKTLGFSIEYTASAILTASSIAIGNSFHVKFKEGWKEKANLYLVLVGNAGDGKSHPLKFAFKPIMDRDYEKYIEYQIALKEYQSLSNKESANTQKPYYQKYILTDFTPESLFDKHKHNQRGIVILADELNGWIKNFNRYSNSGEQETYLAIWSGAPISIDRKSEETTMIQNPFVNIIGGIQTKILNELAKDNRGNNGFIERILFVILNDTSFLEWNDLEIDSFVFNNYSHYINRLFTLDFEGGNPNVISFTEEARHLLMNWRNKIRKEYDDEISRSILAKYEVYAIRFSLIIQLMYWATDNKTKEKVELFAVEKAIKLIEYFFFNAMRVYYLINNINPVANLNKVESIIYKELNNDFTTNEALLSAQQNGMESRTLYRFLSNKSLFIKNKRGIYSKTYF